MWRMILALPLILLGTCVHLAHRPRTHATSAPIAGTQRDDLGLVTVTSRPVELPAGTQPSVRVEDGGITMILPVGDRARPKPPIPGEPQLVPTPSR